MRIIVKRTGPCRNIFLPSLFSYTLFPMTIPKPPVYGHIKLPAYHETFCTEREWYYGTQVGETGDVRRCPEHNRLQVLRYSRDYNKYYWYTPGWFIEPTLYRRVKKAWLATQSDLCASHKKPS